MLPGCSFGLNPFWLWILHSPTALNPFSTTDDFTSPRGAIACGPALRSALQPFALPLLRLAAARPKGAPVATGARRALRQLVGSWSGLRMAWKAWMQAAKQKTSIINSNQLDWFKRSRQIGLGKRAFLVQVEVWKTEDDCLNSWETRSELIV